MALFFYFGRSKYAMIVAKDFKWEAAHRLPWHKGKCKHLHGHSYRMTVELEGNTNSDGLVIDFNDIKSMIEPHILELDHTTLISENDTELKQVFDEKSWKYYLLPFESTAENLCAHFMKVILERNSVELKAIGIRAIGIKISETASAYAYLRNEIN